jgi:hypothetical protein
MDIDKMNFFWEKNSKHKQRSRFNLLLLEYGEYYFEDFSVYLFPVISIYRSYEMGDNFKVQGRLKLCSKSLIFEPLDIRRPVLKFPLKNMKLKSLQRVVVESISSASAAAHSELSGFFTFDTSLYFEMKANDKIGPYRQVDPSSDFIGSEFSTNNGNGPITVLFAVVHSDLSLVLTKIENLRHIFEVTDKEGRGLGEQLITPLIESASITSFDTSQLVNLHEVLILSHPESVRRVKPLILNPGSLMITDLRIYFQPSPLNNTGEQTQILEMRKISRIYRRRYLLRQTGLEIFMEDGTSSLFVFDSRRQRDQIYVTLTHQPNVAEQLLSTLTLEQMTRKWQRKEITNFQYLMYLNTEADRSVNDITQYPVFPHVLVDYTSPKLDLDNPSTFRDLSRPIGALNPTRLNYFKERFHSMAPGNEKLGIPPPFLYGTHYSTPGYVLFYLVRVAPEYMLCLQNGKFDAADRMFHSVADMWGSCLNNPADLKELIPEFFTGNGSFLVNNEDLNLGYRHTGERLGDVELPPWAKSPKDFIKKCAKALESEYVSAHLHEWIDLVFGCKQQGQAAVDSDNLYYYLTYEGSVDLEVITDPRQRNAVEMQIQEFGQTPKQLFVGPHPSRSDTFTPIRVKDNRNKISSTSQDSGSPDKQNSQKSLGQHSSSNSNIAGTSSDGPKEFVDVAASPTYSQKSTGSTDDGLVKIMTLGDEFHAEVVRELTAAGSTPEITAIVNPHLQAGFNAENLNRRQPQAQQPKQTRSQSLLGGTWTKTVNFFGALSGRGNSSPNIEDEVNVENIVQRQGYGNNFLAGQGPNPSGSVTTPSPPKQSASPSLPVSQPAQGTSSSTAAPPAAAEGPKDEARVTTDVSSKPVKSAAVVEQPVQEHVGPVVILDPITRVEMHPSDPVRLHSDSVTGISIIISADPTSAVGGATASVYGKKDVTVTVGGKVHQGPVLATVVSCSKDSLVKVVSVEADVISDVRMVAGGAAGLFRTAIRRTFSGSDPPLTSCCITPDGKQVITACLDNSVYR